MSAQDAPPQHGIDAALQRLVGHVVAPRVPEALDRADVRHLLTQTRELGRLLTRTLGELGAAGRNYLLWAEFVDQARRAATRPPSDRDKNRVAAVTPHALRVAELNCQAAAARLAAAQADAAAVFRGEQDSGPQAGAVRALRSVS